MAHQHNINHQPVKEQLNLNDVVYHEDTMDVGQIVKDGNNQIMLRDEEGQFHKLESEKLHKYNKEAPIVARLNHAEALLKTMESIVNQYDKLLEEHDKVIRMLYGKPRM